MLNLNTNKINAEGVITNKKRMIRSKAIYTEMGVAQDVYLHICDGDTNFTLTIPDGTEDGEEIKIVNRGTGTVNLSGKINETTF